MSQPPRSADNEDTGLMQFLTKEVGDDEFYADLLLKRAEAAERGEMQSGASSDAYYVTFGPQEVVIEHHYLEEWPPVHISYPRFLAALRAWRKRLR